MKRNMSKKICVAVLFGGKSEEHEVSIQSTKNILNALDKKKYEVVLVGIGKSGRWLSSGNSKLLLHSEKIPKTSAKFLDTVVFLPQGKGQLAEISDGKIVRICRIDVVLPVLHGPFGEDGTVQGLLQIADVPFVGSGVLGSAVGMDKDVMKRLLRDAGIPVAKFLVYRKSEQKNISFQKVKKDLSLPIFVKPANLGSSVGISKVRTKQEFEKALETAFAFDQKIILEECISGREIECSVLGNENPLASFPGEIISHRDFYS